MAKIVRVEVHRFSLPFRAPVQVGRETLTSREGFLLALTDDRSRCGYGEIAPLPGLDSLTQERCRRDIPSLAKILSHARLSFHRFRLAAPLLGVVEGCAASWTNHTVFGVECALLGLCLQQKKKGDGEEDSSPLEELQGKPLRIPVNGLFVPDPAEGALERQIETLKRNGVATVKVKIGRLPVEMEIRLIRGLIEGMGKEIPLRLDGNRNLTAAAYRRIYEALHDLSIEYVEEPLKEGPPAGADEVPWPIALDESLAHFFAQREPCFSSLAPAVRAVILKPGLLRGLHAMAGAVTEAKKAGIRIIVSSAFNSGITLAVLGVFSRAAGLLPETVHGLDTLRYLAADLFLPSPEISEGKLEIPEGLLSGGASLNKNCLREKVL